MDVFVWKQLLKNLVLPPTGPLLLALAGLALLPLRRARVAAMAMCAAGFGGLWLLSTPLVADTLVRAAERYPALDLGKPVDAQAIVILGGGVRVDAPEYGRSAPGATTLERLVYGARVARITGLPVLVSGSRYEAASMTDTLQQDLGVNARWVENRSRDTHQNALFSAAILARAGIRKVILVTSAAHMARSVTEFELAGLRVVPAPAAMWTRRDRGVLAFIPNADALVRSQRACYEALGLAVQALRIRFGSLAGLAEPRPPAGQLP
ncbi:MAG TPA: YdcF family protein [Steroidobacteraceae bacterium]|nr:YdcF family protein [Steroidobacteraceae bacterium]